MVVKEVVLATTTLYRACTDVRYVLAMRTAELALQAGYTFVVVDSSPIPEVGDSLSRMGARVCLENLPMGPSRRRAIQLAIVACKRQQGKAIFWLEERDDIIRSIPRIAEPIFEGRADIVIPFRTPKSWATYPDFQVQSEQSGNQAVAKLLGRDDLDVFFGPVMYSLETARLVAECDPDALGIPDTYIPQYMPTYAARLGYRVTSVAIDFVYSPLQKQEEETTLREEMLAKRKNQLEASIAAHTRLATMAF